MCGIAGFVHFDLARPASVATLGRMTDTLVHRGPDGGGAFTWRNVALGHRRLAIIDLEGGVQPLLSDDESVAVVFNGEIYNYVELRAELSELGHQFRTSSDTEVLVHGYEEWGLELPSKLNGMWAFGLWDCQRRRLFLSRDRIGEKPLYYAVVDNSLIFGSELKALEAYGVPLEPDMSMSEVYLTLGYVPSPYTFLKDVRKLPPASCITVRGETVSEDPYWDLPPIPEEEMNRSSASVCEQFEHLLRDSVRIRMRSDVDFGAFLSGGLDSSSIVSIMADISPRPVQTFTVGFEDKELDERPLARAVAERFRTRHHEQVVEQPSFEDSVLRILHFTDEPFGDSSCIPTERVAAHARRHVKMVLSGDGGDEVLSGYNSYQSERLASYLGNAPAPMVRVLAGTIRAAARPFGSRFNHLVTRAAKTVQLSSMPFEQRLLKKLWADVAVVRALLADVSTAQISVEDYLSDFFRVCPWRDPFYQLMYYNLKSTLPEDMLTKVDRMSMANSLEVRTPFLDHRLIELMCGVHKDVKLPRFERKAVLRRTVGKSLPECVRRARKQGFVAPVRNWFAEKRMWAQDNILDCPIPLRKEVVMEILDANSRNEANYGNFLWMIVQLTTFLKRRYACVS